MGVIYQITFTNGSRSYIGSAHHLYDRKKSHLSRLRKGTHHSRALQNAFLKHGEAAITWTVLETVNDRSALIEREQVWLDAHAGQLYNTSPTAASRLGAKMSAEARAKISASLKGNSYRTGIPFRQEQKRMISASLIAAYASGRKKATPNPQNLAAHNAAYKRGEIKHPRHNPEREQKIISDYMVTKDMAATGKNFGVTGGAISYILKKNNVTKFKRTNYARVHHLRH